MSDDGEWHTVTNSKAHAAPAPAPTPASKTRRKSRPHIKSNNKPKQPTKQQHHANKEKKPNNSNASVSNCSGTIVSNPFHAVEDDDSEEEEDDGQVDPIDLPVPPYHTTVIVSCPLEDCESPIPFMDTTSLAKHLRKDHKIVFKNLHHMYMALDAYLSRWAKELVRKPLTELGQLESKDDSQGKKRLSPEKLHDDLNL
jgi:hypothetical protein